MATTLTGLLTPCDFFFVGNMKDNVFSTSQRDIDELRETIIR